MAEGKEPKKFTKDEIESHSSALTNKRIDAILQNVNQIEYNLNVKYMPSIQDAMPYHAVLFTLWNETKSFYRVNDKLWGEVQQCIGEGEQAMVFLRSSGPEAVKQYHVEWLIKNCKKLRSLMHYGMQSMGYFYRFGKRDPGSIKEHILLFRQKKWKAKETKNEVPKPDN